MERFHIIEDAAVITRTKGVYKQGKVYRRGNAIYVGAAGGFVRLYKGGSTGMPNLSWDDIEIPGYEPLNLKDDAHGKLSLPGEIKTISGN